ncbi:hypothetical protein H6G91_27230 [Nostoc muscorum FACHB-395]|nr:hypothetical protein [Desmonostoc muscorum FACHB-395]
MNVGEVLDTVEQSLLSRELNSLERFILCHSWLGRGYSQMAPDCAYSIAHIKDIGSQLWQALSKALGERVTKKNLFLVLKQYLLSRTGETVTSEELSVTLELVEVIDPPPTPTTNQLPVTTDFVEASYSEDSEQLIRLSDRPDLLTEESSQIERAPQKCQTFTDNKVIKRVRDMIEIAQFTTEQAKIYWQALNQLNLNFICQNQPFQYGFPLIISAKIADQLYQASQEIEDYILALATDTDALSERITQRFNSVVGQPLNLKTINSYLVKHLQSGLGIPIGYDVLVTDNFQDRISLRVTEVQSGITYPSWMCLILQAARTALGENQEELLNQLFEPAKGLKAIKQLTQTPNISIVDVDPVRQDSRIDLQAMSESLPGSHLVSIYEIYRHGVHWLADIHDSTGRLLKTVKIENIICRMVPDEIREVLSTLQKQPDRIREVLEFFLDSSLNWIWHPAWQNIFDKRDLAALKNLPTAHQHYVETIQQGDVPPGVYFQKSVDGHGGANQSIVKVQDKYSVPEGFILQPYLVKKRFEYIAAEGGLNFDCSVELRIMRNLSLGTTRNQSGAYFMARIAPYEVEGKSVKNGMKEIHKAASHILDQYKQSSRNIHHWQLPFGFSPVLIQP